ncbi:alpha/beta hydrolase [Alloscardovia theropitheci]|uniref:Alpha/beta hydrolase n=1 Tax=Alloscardovia theropitheci TaxID=2496842 RepID=A0A4R0QUY1_9BIFI|nr:alpha/beta hydrolase [Alloscardovia theropitheci]TCD53897.1 alpha/beta hydrolase [Alloscardovia theropitheci]
MSYINTENKVIDVKNTKIVYRELGMGKSQYQLVMLTHLSATFDNWDPLLLDLLAQNHHVIVLDLPGVGASEGKVPPKIELMAQQAIDIFDALGLEKINLLGLSMGGMVAQEIVRLRGQMVNKLILAGTGPRGGYEVDKVTGKTFRYMIRAAFERVDPKRYIFYTHDDQGAREAQQVLSRMGERAEKSSVRDKEISVGSFIRQLKAIKRWGKEAEDNLSFITQPTLIVNGDQDMQVPTQNSYDMHDKISQSELVIYPQAGHGSIFQYAQQFAHKVQAFLNA